MADSVLSTFPPKGHADDEMSWIDMVKRYGPKDRSKLCGGYMTDLAVAYQVAMVSRQSPDFEGVITTARDRIRWLSIQLALANAALEEVRRPPTVTLDDEIEAPVNGGWMCKSRVDCVPHPEACGWPFCGCEPKVIEVLAALRQCGFVVSR